MIDNQIISKIQTSFSKLEFNEEEHLYNVENKPFTSVSKKIDTFVKKEDFDIIAYNIAKKISITRGRENEVMEIKADILAEWKETNDEAKDRGHRVHLFGEKYVFDRTVSPTIIEDEKGNRKSCPQEQAIVKFWNEVPSHIIPACIELRMYHPSLAFAGTSDILLFDTKSKTFIIADYKTNKDLFKNHQEKKLLAPFDNLLDNPYNKYQIQLSFYQILFEQTGYKVSSRKIIWLLKTGEYVMYEADDLTSQILKIQFN